MKTVWWIALLLTIIGALNWGLVGLFEFDLVYYLFGSMMTVGKVIYVLVGLSGLFLLFMAFGKKCGCHMQ